MNSSNLSIAYVLTSSGKDTYADMTLVSMLSTRLTNPSTPLHIVCDSETADALDHEKHRVLENCDLLTRVDTPTGSATFRNRWIKTQLNLFTTGDVLFLDSDTLVRHSLHELPCHVADFGAVANHNASTLNRQIWIKDAEHIAKLGWPREFETYFNAGVWFFRRSSSTDRIFKVWHQAWKSGIELEGRERDQAAFNHAIRESRIQNVELPTKFNQQLSSMYKNSHEAIIWHFYTGKRRFHHRYTDVINAASVTNTQRLKSDISRMIRMPFPYRSDGTIARHIANFFSRRENIPAPVFEILSKQYTRALLVTLAWVKRLALSGKRTS